MWQYRYTLPDGRRWQNWALAEEFQEALENCQFHGQGRPFEIMRHEMIECIRDVIVILEKTKAAFKSKSIEQARQRLEKIV